MDTYGKPAEPAQAEEEFGEKNEMETAVREMYREITQSLIRLGLQITTMESCTSGQVASLITDTEGSSAVFKGAYITYSNEVKIMLGVPANVIDSFGVYSEECAREMAKVCRERFNADIGLGITGTMGNVDPVNADSVPGVVYFAIDMNGLQSFVWEIPPQTDRLRYKLFVAMKVGEVLLSRLKALR